jgi:DNA-binding response OmpR family regulator
MLSRVAGPIVSGDRESVSVILTVGEGVSAEALHHCFAAPLIEITHVNTIGEAEALLSDPRLSLVIVDAGAAQEADSEGLLTVLRARSDLNRVPIVILTEALTKGKPVLPVLPFGSDPAPLSGMNAYLKAFLASEARSLTSV